MQLHRGIPGAMEDMRSRTEPWLDELGWLRALARRLVRDPDRADDAVQETLVAAMTHASRGGRTPRTPRVWLASILRNQARQEQRSRTRRAAREAHVGRPDRARSTLEVVEELSLHRRLVEAVHELDEPYRSVIVMRFLRSQSVREISRELGVPSKTVHTRIERALAHLRRKLAGVYGGGSRGWLAVLTPFAHPPAAELGWGIGSMVVPMKTKMTVATLGAVALGAIAYLPFALAPKASSPDASRPAQLALGETEAGQPATRSPAEPERRRAVAAAVDSERDPAQSPEAHTAPVPLVTGVVRELDGQAVASIDIVFELDRSVGSPVEPAPPQVVATSGHDGRFSFPHIPAAGRLSVASDRFASVSRPYLRGPTAPEPVLVVVAPNRAYAGRVVDADGRPVEGAAVEISREGSFLQSEALPADGVDGQTVHWMLPFAEQRTGDDGGFRFKDVGFVAGAYIEASRDGFAPTRIDLPEASQFELRMVLQRAQLEGRFLHGVVFDPSGAPALDAHVSLGGASVRTGVDGRFALELADWERSGTLWAVQPGTLPASWEFADSAASLGRVPEHPIELFLGGTTLMVRGRVLDGEGRPVARATVWSPDVTSFGLSVYDYADKSITGQATVEGVLSQMARGPWWRFVETHTDESGSFELMGLLEHDYELYALELTTLAGAGPVRATPVPVGSVQNGVLLELERGGAEPVAGRVVSRAGMPLEGIKVAVGRRIGAERQVVRTLIDDTFTHTDANGRFRFPALHVAGTFFNLSGPDIALAETFALDGQAALTELEIAVTAASRFRVELSGDPSLADAFAFIDEAGTAQALFVRVEGHNISTGEVDLIDGRSGIVVADEGEHLLALYRKGVEVGRFPLELSPGGVHVVDPLSAR